ncbi:MAG: bifunctional UDP-3-O-[3-hydroxymyristoyl] N-acetylglucosamine deacetylase/3-hydroxyacyl-ACP dehydratase [Chitinophagales bacterium]|nr:bifunctional UDP-3-O-[3-hydroxymyristoyl] N-acetylglucosamine deacetylase/3-hydroxyacyl-ACP dehydratase [Chitinophagales bacterium]MDW8427524.1 bifunctional UDP-3-O-[3-hydroxymyristoyl] N-acetylglucosamine deacetylase/3-hydroxyacyl-ACP dehydratase [Chitinophagales bacterium]
MQAYQQTLKRPFTVSGIGVHTGESANVTVHPAPGNHGIVFRRIDLDQQPCIKADVDMVTDVSRGTTLGCNGVRVMTVEHLLAALAGCEIDNALIDIDGPEVPILDGSSRLFTEAILDAGIEVQTDFIKEYHTLTKNIIYKDESRNVELVAIPSEDYQLSVMIDYNSNVLGPQHATVDHISEFRKEIAQARTFCFLHEIESLLDKNLIRGGSLDNALVIVDRKIDEQRLRKLAVLFNREDIEVEEGYLNNVTLRYRNEPARHKLLDIVGDLALVGYPFKAKIIAHRPGHAANIEFAKLIKAHIKENKQMKNIPQYDPNAPPVMDIRKIARYLPHKYPFLLVDKIIEMSDHHVVGVKCVTFNEAYFQGHFPGNPVMPGVLQIEAMAQTGGLLVLNTVSDPENWDTYFLKIDQAKFKNKVVPGDTLIMKLELLSPIRRGLCEMKGTVYVGNKVVTEAHLVAKIVRKEQG